MIPSIGRIVIYCGPAAISNGATEAPALITRVWAGQDTATCTSPERNLVNLAVFSDFAELWPVGNVSIYDSLEKALAAKAGDKGAFCYWPPRV